MMTTLKYNPQSPLVQWLNLWSWNSFRDDT
jgi:hypothetical protein